MSNEPTPDPADERIRRMRAELEADAKTLFTDAPDPGPVPEVLRQAAPAARPAAKSGSDAAGMAKAWGIALDFVFTLLAGAGLGWLIDWWLHIGPWGLLAGLGLGFVIAFWRIVQTTQRQEAAERERRGRG